MKTLASCSVFIVDDMESNIDILVNALQDNYEIHVALDGQSALELVANSIPDLLLLDIMMPGMDGFEVLRRLKANPKTMEIPVIFLTALDRMEDKTKGFELGAIDYITKPFDISEVLLRTKTHLSLKLAHQELALHNITLEKEVLERTKELALTQEATITSMATLAEYRDPETGGHIHRTKNYVRVLAEKIKRHPKFSILKVAGVIDLLYRSAPLHDIGKIGVPDNILLKPGKLTEEEFHVMKKHVQFGRDAIQAAENRLKSKSSFLRFAKEIAYCHHEKWDGSGYPRGIKGDEIPVSARLMAIADVYDALISKRVYKPPFTHTRAVEMIGKGRGSHFDPVMVDTFVDMKEDFRNIAIHFADFEEEKESLAQ